MSETIKESVLRELASANTTLAVRVVGQHGGGFAVIVEYGAIEKTLAGTRGELRVFASLDTAAGVLRKIGVTRFEVDSAGYEPGLVRRPRPDRAEALKKTRTRPRQQALL